MCIKLNIHNFNNNQDLYNNKKSLSKLNDKNLIYLETIENKWILHGQIIFTI